MQPETSSNQTLVHKVQQGDSKAVDLLVSKYQYNVIGLIGRYVQDKYEMLNVYQNSFIRIRARLVIDSFRGEIAFHTWLYPIVVNKLKTI